MKANITYSDNPMRDSMISKFNSFRPEFRESINESHNMFMQNMGNVNNVFQQQFNQVNDFYNNNIELNNAIENLTDVGKMNDDLHIYPVGIDNYEHIGINMRRYIMAEPEINRLYKLNRIEGFGGEFINNSPDAPISENGDYLSATSGMLTFDEDGNGVIKTYVSTEDEVLTTAEKINIRESWDFVKMMINNDDDITSL